MPNITKEMQDKGLIITQEDIKQGKVIAIKATDRQTLIDTIREFIKESDIPENGVLLHVELQDEQTGYRYFRDYKAEDDIPYDSVPCPCGNPEHWLIKYDNEPNS